MSSIARYGGLPIFGVAVSSDSTLNERVTQKTHYFGLNGVEVIDGGSQGGKVTFQGWIVGTSLSDLVQRWTTFESFQDNVERVLVDTLGRSYSNARLTSLSSKGRPLITTGKACRSYHATFEIDS